MEFRPSTAHPSGTAAWWRRLGWPALLLAATVAVAALISVALPAASIGLYFERSYNEGWNAYHAARAAAGETLYAGDPWRQVNYPFLSFYLVAWLKPLFGDVLMIGRALNLAALAAVVGCSALIVRRFGGGAIEMLFTAGCVLGLQQIQAANWIAADEPQMLAEAFALGGLLVYVSGRPTMARLLGCAFLFAAGGFAKQIVVVFPAAVTLDLLWRDRNMLVRWGLCLVLAASVFAAASAMIAGGDFLAEVLAPRLWHWKGVIYHTKKLGHSLKAPVAALALFLCLPLPAEQRVLWRAAGLVALGAGIVFAGGDGVSTNVFLELAVLMGITAGLALTRWRRIDGHRPALAALLFVLPFLFAAPIVGRMARNLPPLLDAQASWQALALREAQFQAAASWLAARDGPALCESLLLCFAAGKPMTIDPFNTAQQILTGRTGEEAILAAIADHRFAVIALPGVITLDPKDPGRAVTNVWTAARFTNATLLTIRRYYAPVATLPSAVFYAPRRPE